MTAFFKNHIKSIIRSQGREIISTASNSICEKTSLEELLNLINSLCPRKTEKPLIRLGPVGDGGYLVPNDLEGIYALFSPGVSSVSGFEKDCANMGMKVFMADKSVDAPVETHESFEFTKKYIGCIDNESYMTLDTWAAESLSKKLGEDLILQMDIEGAEYESLLSISSGLLKQFRIIVIEFHQLEQLWNKPFFDLASSAFAKLLQFHSCVHIHPNNYCGAVVSDGIEIPMLAEFTFLRNDRGVLPEYVLDIPNPLDQDNTQNPTLELPPIWLSGAGKLDR